MNKLYYPINWENYPSEATPVNESNLNKIDSGLNNFANVWTTLEVVKESGSISASFDSSTGTVTLTFSQGAGFYSLISF